jgi:hypothetical protein
MELPFQLQIIGSIGIDEDLISPWKVFRDFQKFTYIAGIFICGRPEMTTVFGSGYLRGRECIKECYMKIKESPGEFTPITLWGN